jgi:hypothetical protein
MADGGNHHGTKDGALRVLVCTDPATGDGFPDGLGRALASGLTERLDASTERVTVDCRAAGPAEELLAELDRDPGEWAGAGVVVLSVAADLAQRSGDTDAGDRYLGAMAELVRRLKLVDTYVILLNGSTLIPGETVSCYRDIPEPASLTLQRLNAAVMELSPQPGISVLDVDRVIAEVGGDENVTGLLTYSHAAESALCDELVRILRDTLPLGGRAVTEGSGERAPGTQLRLEVPQYVRPISKAMVLRWHVAEGDAMAFGLELVDIEILEVSVLRRHRNQQHLANTSGKEDRLSVRSPRRRTVLRITAAEEGIVARIFATEETIVGVGDLLAVVCTGEAGEVGEPPAVGGPVARVAVGPTNPDRPANRPNRRRN